MSTNDLRTKKAADKLRARVKLRENFTTALTARLTKLGVMSRIEGENAGTILRHSFPIVEKYKEKGMTYAEILFVLETLCGVKGVTENAIALAYRRFRDCKKYGGGTW